MFLMIACESPESVSLNLTDAPGSSAAPGTPASGGSTSSSPSGPLCTVQNVTGQVRIMIMLDNSGSTATTDPNDKVRVDTVNTFLATYGSKTNLTYSLGYFSQTASIYDMKSGRVDNNGTAFGTAAQEAVALSNFETVAAQNATWYQSAFSALQSTIEADIAAGNNETYVVIFMSDGMNNDNGNPSTTGMVKSLLAAAPGSAGKSLATVSTVFFGSPDPSAMANLQGMATAGLGNFIDTNVTTTFSLDGLISLPSEACVPASGS